MNNSIFPQKVLQLLRDLYPYSKKDIGAALILFADAFCQIADTDQTACMKDLLCDIFDHKIQPIVVVRKMKPRSHRGYATSEEKKAKERQD